MNITIETSEGKALVRLDGIASSGLRLFFLLLRNTKPNGCKIFIKGAAAEVMEIFKATGFDRCFQFI